MSTATKSFTGRVGGVTYTDPGLFEQAAKDLGYVGMGARRGTWKNGTPVRIRLDADGTEVDGQVWSRSNIDRTVWVALDNGTYVLVQTRSGIASVLTEEGAKETVGRVA